MYEAVTAYPAGRSTVSRFARAAASHGYEGIVVRNATDVPGDLEPVRDETAVDVVAGVELPSGPRDELLGHIGAVRPDTTLLIVRGGDATVNRFVAETEQVDVLATPGDAVDHVIVKQARDHGVHLEVDLRPVLSATGGKRVRSIEALSTLARLIEHYDAPYVISGRPASHLELRSHRELTALGEICGLDREWVTAGLHAWRALAERNRRIQSDRFVEPGVEVEEER